MILTPARLFGLAALLGVVSSAEAATVVTVSRTILHPIDHRVFGVMTERADWDGEGGTEGAWDPSRGTWKPGIVPLWDRLGATVVRFPGGGLADRYDWRWGIDHVPGRSGPRPIIERADTQDAVKIQPPGTASHTGVETNFVGTDEAAALCARTGAQLSVTVNTLWFQDDVARGAALAADWVEYCNARDDGSNPNGGVDWAHVRALNGHPRPYNVKLWEIGNEVWLLPNFPRERYGRQVAAYADAMRKVDPGIEIIADGQDDVLRNSIATYAGRRVQYLALHRYEPHSSDLGGMTAQQVWDWLAAIPTGYWDRQLDEFRQFIKTSGMGYRVALTEWNILSWSPGYWNWRSWPDDRPKYVPLGLSAAAWLDDIIRNSDLVPIANVSMLFGSNWGNTMVRYPTWAPDRAAVPFYIYYVIKLFAHNTGDRLLAQTVDGDPTYDMTVARGFSEPRKNVPYLNVLSSRDGRNLYVHVINRHRDTALPITIDLGAWKGRLAGTGVRSWLASAGPMAEPWFDALGAVSERSASVRLVGGRLTLMMPPRSITAISLPLRHAISWK